MSTEPTLQHLSEENARLRARVLELEAPSLSPNSQSPTPTTPTQPTEPTDPNDFQEWGRHILSWLVDYRSSCQDLPVISTVQPNYLRDALPDQAPEQGESWQAVMHDLNELIVPGLTHWESQRRFFAYFKPHSSYPAVLGETLCAGLNVMGFDWIASPACTELEVVTLDWLAKILNLPTCFLSSSSGLGGGVIQGSAGESATVVLTAAIERTRTWNTDGGDGDSGTAAAGGEEAAGVVGGMSVTSGPLRRDLMVVYG